MQQPGMTVILSTMERSEAEVVSGVLDASEIFNVIDADDAGQTNPELDVTQFVRVLVRDADVIRAQEVLKTARETGSHISEDTTEA